MGQTPAPWWEQRRYLVLLALAVAVPLVWPTTPPLTDLPGHMGRYAVQLDGGADAVMAQWYEFKWALIGNLGVDLLVQAFGPLFGIEATVKVVALAIPVMMAAGMLLVAREVHGRVPPTSLFALPLSLSFPFQYGFINYCLAIALAFLMFALWLRLTRMERWRLRAAIFIPASFLLWLTHIYGWGILGLMVGGSELMRLRSSGKSWPASVGGAALAGAQLAGPVVLLAMAAGNGAKEFTGDWFNWAAKLGYALSALRDRWQLLDFLSIALIVVMIYRGARRPGERIDPRLGLVALLLGLAYLVMPRILIGSAYADMRLMPVILAMALLAVRPEAELKLASRIALVAALFIGVRVCSSTVSMVNYDSRYTAALGAVDHLPRNARVLALVGSPCSFAWGMPRLEHVPALATVRRHAFINDQWEISTANLLTVTRPDAPTFRVDPSQLVAPEGCNRPDWRTTSVALSTFPRDAFDFVWLIEMHPLDISRFPGLERQWTNGRDSLYRVVKADEKGTRP